MKKRVEMNIPREIVRFITAMSEYEYYKKDINKYKYRYNYYINACDKLINCVVEVSGREKIEVEKFYQEMYDMDLPYNNPFPTSYFMLMTKLFNSITQEKDKEKDMIKLESDENKLIQIATLFKVDLVKTKELLESEGE